MDNRLAVLDDLNAAGNGFVFSRRAVLGDSYLEGDLLGGRVNFHSRSLDVVWKSEEGQLGLAFKFCSLVDLAEDLGFLALLY